MLLILILAVMISVLIPVYNYNVVDLVTNLHTQMELCNIPFEIICFDDHSQENYLRLNQKISSLSYTSLIESQDNVGRIAARQALAEASNYHWLLFLDADVMPKSEHYLQMYLNCLDKNADAIYGGFAYNDSKPDHDKLLRWTYGKTHEQVAATKRNEKPYKVIISANFMIRRGLFLALNMKIDNNRYGNDNFFGALLKTYKVNVLHIDNEVFHLGIESSETYLKKKEKAAETLLELYNKDQIQNHQNDLLKLFIRLKRYGLHHLFSILYKGFQHRFKHNLLGPKPSMTTMQLYRISYMCYKALNTK